jgi:toxin ParE1/3/4
MIIVFTKEAKTDLDELRDWLRPLSPRGLANVTAALEAKIRLLSENPTIGRPTPREGVRETIETKYGFLIPYWIKGEQLYILRIYRSNRKPLDYDNLKAE